MKVTQIKRPIQVVSQSWNAGEWTLTTSAAHFLLPADTVKFIDPYNPQEYTMTLAAGTTGSTIKIASSDSKLVFPPFLYTDIFRTGQTGGQEKFTFSFGQNPNAVVQAYVSGTGGAVFDLEASATGSHWQKIATVTLAAGAHGFVNVTAAWPYGRLNLTSIDAGTVLKAVLAV